MYDDAEYAEHPFGPNKGGRNDNRDGCSRRARTPNMDRMSKPEGELCGQKELYTATVTSVDEVKDYNLSRTVARMLAEADDDRVFLDGKIFSCIAVITRLPFFKKRETRMTRRQWSTWRKNQVRGAKNGTIRPTKQQFVDRSCTCV